MDQFCEKGSPIILRVDGCLGHSPPAEATFIWQTMTFAQPFIWCGSSLNPQEQNGFEIHETTIA